GSPPSHSVIAVSLATESAGSANAKKLRSATAPNAPTSPDRSADDARMTLDKDIANDLRREGFVDVSRHAEVAYLVASGRGSVGRDDDLHEIRHSAANDLAEQFHAVHLGHVDVGQDGVDLPRIEHVERTAAVLGLVELPDVEVRELHRALDERAHHRRVVHDQNLQRPHGSLLVIWLLTSSPPDVMVSSPSVTHTDTDRAEDPPTASRSMSTPFRHSRLLMASTLRLPMAVAPTPVTSAPPTICTRQRFFSTPYL